MCLCYCFFLLRSFRLVRLMRVVLALCSFVLCTCSYVCFAFSLCVSSCYCCLGLMCFACVVVLCSSPCLYCYVLFVCVLCYLVMCFFVFVFFRLGGGVGCCARFLCYCFALLCVSVCVLACLV